MDGNRLHKDFDTAMKERFGGKVYRLSLSTGCTCPNRDGSIGTGGCIFCSEGGSGDFAARGTDVRIQIEEAKKRVSSKLTKNFRGYVAYFQSFTNTYARTEEEFRALRDQFFTAAMQPEILAVSIATRPDCLPEKTVQMLAELNRIKPVWVELGLQTIHEKTAGLILRGYSLPVYDRAVWDLKEAGIEVIVHLIIGLPGETEEMIKETVRHVAQQKVDGVKFQLLQVLSGTRLKEMLDAGSISVPEYSPEEYARLLRELAQMLPEETVIHRFTGDAPKKLLVSPLWTADKKRVLNTISAAFR